jgi:DNA-binding MarR family transcriptional regulator
VSVFISPESLDSLIHERVRLGITSALAAGGELPFTQLRDMLKVTDGNLSVHARLLADAGYVRIDKAFVDKRPRTTLSLTAKGRTAFEKYVARLEDLVRGRRA